MASHPTIRPDSPPAPPADAHVRAAREVLAELFGPPADRSFAVRLWDGTEEPGGRRPPLFTLVIRRPGSLRRMLLPPTERRMGEAFLRDDFDVEGSMEAAAGLARPLRSRFRSPAAALRLLRGLRRLPRRDVAPRDADSRRARRQGRLHGRRRDAVVVRHHYEVGNDFYRLWLDRRLVYSCGYFPEPDTDLDAAQEAKLELICRKLRLHRGERFLDIGCGWGALLLHAAERYGVEATGVTLSEAQAELARERIAAAGLADRCRVEVRDYRDLPADARYDKIASVGMVEHVGRPRLPEYYDHAFRLLEPGGLFLNHGIVFLGERPARLGQAVERRLRRWRSFIDAYVFPDSELVTPTEMIAPAEAAGFELRDVESLREHYAETLRHWVRRLEVQREAAIRAVGEPTYRVWRLYMAGSAHEFASGRIGVIQMLLARRDASGGVRLPRTRADIHAA